MPPDAVITQYILSRCEYVAVALADPSRWLAAFFAPARMKLLEIVKGECLHQRLPGHAVAKAWPSVVAGVCDGIGIVVGRCGKRLILSGWLSPWDIDAAMVDFGYAMGPYEAGICLVLILPTQTAAAR